MIQIVVMMIPFCVSTKTVLIQTEIDKGAAS